LYGEKTPPRFFVSVFVSDDISVCEHGSGSRTAYDASGDERRGNPHVTEMPVALTEAPKNVEGSTGTFTHSVPIAAPGYYGVEPNLAFVYNSSSRNGLLGVGWSLSGFSMIERRGPNYSFPQWDDTDVFYLDGEPLVPCSLQSFKSPTCRSLPAGLNASTVYSTQHESYRRIFQSATGDWTVYRKDGSVAKYTLLPARVSAGT
jgi:hypothetical protein